AEQGAVQRPRRLQVAPERLLDDDACTVRASRRGKLLNDFPEQRRRDRKVECRPLRGAERLAQGLKRRRGLGVAVPVVQPARQLLERAWIETAVLLDTVARPGTQLVDAPAGPRYANHRHVEMAALRHRLQRGEYLLVRQVARGPEEHQRVGCPFAHDALSRA